MDSKQLVRTWFVFAFTIAVIGCSKNAGSNEEFIATSSGLKYKIIKQGSGDPAKAGDNVLIFETTSYLNGEVLYSNEGSDNPFPVLIGGNQSTAAMDEALRGMQVGEIRQIIAPPELVKRKTYPQNMSPDSSLTIRNVLHKIL
jgi:FKBP-type peptidyl-prolyl cis-trans isomerase